MNSLSLSMSSLLSCLSFWFLLKKVEQIFFSCKSCQSLIGDLLPLSTPYYVWCHHSHACPINLNVHKLTIWYLINLTMNRWSFSTFFFQAKYDIGSTLLPKCEFILNSQMQLIITIPIMQTTMIPKTIMQTKFIRMITHVVVRRKFFAKVFNFHNYKW